MPKPRPKPKNEDDFIKGGGSEPAKEVSQELPLEPAKIQPVKVRIPDELLKKIDKRVNSRRPSPSRHQWILEALWEKIEREPE